MPEIIIRPATSIDLPVLSQFQQGVAEAERPFNAAISPGEVTYYDIAHLIEDDHTQMLVAESDGQVISCGYAQIREAKPYLRHEKFAYLGFMYVEPAFRGRGINAQVLAALKKWIHSKDIREIRLEVYAGNAAALKAYEKAGFKPLLIEMELSI